MSKQGNSYPLRHRIAQAVIEDNTQTPLFSAEEVLDLLLWQQNSLLDRVELALQNVPRGALNLQYGKKLIDAVIALFQSQFSYKYRQLSDMEIEHGESEQAQHEAGRATATEQQGA
jgi:hypothetical protein